MKPRTECQRYVVALSEKLPSLSDKQKQWAFEHCFKDDAYCTKNTIWCLHCGEIFKKKISSLLISVVGEEVVCPNCGDKLKLKNSRLLTARESSYYTIITTFRGYQVCRHFLVERVVYKWNNPIISINEAVQSWVDEKGRETIIARPCKPIMWVYDAWDFSKPMEVRRRRMYSSKYDIDSGYLYPRRRVLPIIKRNGYNGDFHNVPPNEFFKLILSDHEAEALIKNCQFSLFNYKWKRGYLEYKMPFAHAVRIAIRNRYVVQDVSLWYDYLKLLEYFHYDTHNAHYVCPGDLGSEHDRLLARKERIEAKIESEQLLNEIAALEDDYSASKSKFFGICFGNENIRVAVVKSVLEMAEEGKSLHHCVFRMQYYKRPNSLILSAKDRAGRRIETIEIDLKSMKIVQSRGCCNKLSPQHDEIVNLVNENISLIRQAI